MVLFQTHSSEIESNGDVKFLYLVNAETRKLIERSSRASDLKETVKVKEMCRRYRLWSWRGSFIRGVSW